MKYVWVTALVVWGAGCITAGAGVPAVAAAQALGGEATVSLESIPTYPAPESEVTLRLNAYALDPHGMTVRWFENGEEVPEAYNKREAVFQTGAAGTPLRVEVLVGTAAGIPVLVTRTITPELVDVIIEADTYTPPFYRGRALPSSGARVRAVAVTSFDGEAPLYYHWTLGGEVLGGAPARNQPAVSFTFPRFRSPVLTLEITDGAGVVRGGTIVPVEQHTPQVHFYEERPLRGTAGASIETLPLIGEEVTVRAEPFFVSPELADNEAALDWRIDGRAVAGQEGAPRALTLRRTGGSGSATVTFQAVNREALQQHARGSFTVRF